VSAGASVAFLRGINIGGRRATSSQLVEAVADLGFEDVSTFLASGNILVRHREEPDPLAIATALEATLGYAVPTTVRSSSELEAIIAGEPFSAAELAASAGKPQVILLFDPPTEQAKREVLALSTDEDRLAVGRRHLYWLPARGVGRSELDLASIALGVSTVRTANTIRRLAAKL
jgi:uncharacterized protein (DUF1697 family)